VPEHVETANQQLDRALAGEEVPPFDLDIITRQGARLTLELDVHAIRIDDDIVGIQGVARDITGRRQLEAQLRQAQKMEAIGRLAGGVAHDFNNVLTVIMGCSELALQQLDDADPVRHDIAEIQRAAASASALTRQLLIFSRKNITRPTVLDLDDLVHRLSKMLRRLVPEDIALDVHTGGGGCIEADAGQIEQVIMNLVVNARDAMPTGGRLVIETSRVDLDAAQAGSLQVAQGDFVTLTIRDTGTGIPADVQARIFEPFFTTKDPGIGTGLGLAIVHGIVRQAGGGIGVASTPGRGTTFKIYLPAAIAAGAAVSVLPPVRMAHAGTGAVLFVEDDDDIRRLGVTALRSRGYTVTAARHAEDALDMVRRGARFDLMVTDIVMPGLSGRALAERLRQQHPTLKVLYTSGYADDVSALKDIQADGAAFLQKPYGLDALARAVEAALTPRPAVAVLAAEVA
jgi:signal transduction histidine kinase/CheY-like chemotaxis protein